MADTYYTIHGRQLTVFQNEDNELLISAAQMKGAGFALFRKDTFDCTLKDDQVDDLTLHLLSEAKNYILKNKVNAIDENVILGTIEKCKQQLMKHNSEMNQPTGSRLVQSTGSSISVTTPNNRKVNNFHEDNSKFSPRPNSAYHRARSVDRNSFPDQNFKVSNVENREVRRSLNQVPRNAQWTNQGNKNFQKFSGNNGKYGAEEKQDFRNHVSFSDNSQNGQKPPYFKSGARQNLNFSKPTTSSRNFGYDQKGNVQKERYQNQQSRNFTSSNFKSTESSNLNSEITALNDDTTFVKSSFSDNRKYVASTPREKEQANKSNFSHQNLRPPRSVQEGNRDNLKRLDDISELAGKTLPGSKIESESAQPKPGLDVQLPKPDLEVKLPKPDLEEKLPRSNLELGSIHKVQISYLHPNKSNVCWVQREESVEAFNDMMIQILEVEAKLPLEHNVQKGQLVLGSYEEVWCRGEVTSVNPTIVNFVDYGNQSEIVAVKPLPDDLKRIPAFAFEVEINKVDVELEDGMELTIEVKKCNGEVSLVELVEDKPAVEIGKVDKSKDDEPPVEEKPKEEVKPKEYFNLPKQLKSLANGKKVKMMDFRDGTLFVKTKECMEKSNELNAYIQGLDLTALTLSKVKEGQLVLCNRHGMTGLSRAIIIKKTSDTSVTVRYLDHAGSDDLSIKCLWNIDDYLAEYPITLLMFPKTDMLDNLQGKHLEYVNELIEKQAKATLVVLDESIDLQLKTGELLSEALQNLSRPKPEPIKEEPEPIKEEPELEKTETSTDVVGKVGDSEADERIMYDDMGWVELETKEYSLYCYYVKDVSELVMVLTDAKCESYVCELLCFQMKDTEPYAPQQYEMCMGYYQSAGDSEEVWYRVMILEIQGDEYLVTSVDYGGEVTLNRSKLRKLPKDLKKIPILGIRCELLDVPSTDKINSKLTELILPGEIYDVNVKELNEETFKYKIEIPAINGELKNLGLI